MSRARKSHHRPEFGLTEYEATELPRPTPSEVVQYFESTYGSERLYFTITPFSNDQNALGSTFGSDNFAHIQPWTLVQTAKLLSGRVNTIAMVVRVFDWDRRVEINGPKGKISIPEKELYMFRFDRESSIGFDPDATCSMFCTDAETGARLPLEEGLRFGSGELVVAIIQGLANPDITLS